MGLDSKELENFERYAFMLGIPHSQWDRAKGNYESALRNQTDEKRYRVMSALDYFCGALEIGNVYLRFIVLVCTAERLFSKKNESNKKKGLGNRMPSRLSGEQAQLGKDIEADYDKRNNLVHGQELPRLSPEEVKRLCAKWAAWCAETLRYLLLTDGAIDALPQIAGSADAEPESLPPQ